MELVLENALAQVRVDAERGGRIASLVVGGSELLEPERPDPLEWGLYPMIPFAGRIRDGRFAFAGTTHRLPPTLGPHALHGNGFTSAWTVVGDDEIAWEFSSPWPFAGRASQRFELDEASLRLEMTVIAAEEQPVSVGWHPWFRREMDTGETLELEFEAEHMYLLDEDGIPTGDLVEPSAGPWDDCFTNVTRGPRLRWGSLVLDLTSSSDHWVVYDERDNAVCVEPQTGPPDMVNTNPRVLGAGETLRSDFTLDWSSLLA